jgi:(p)ppGpp synthase/HD superfamily hydrolase
MNLERAIEIAKQAHAGQKDKAGADYIGHPLRVMASMNTLTEQITAVLHDVIEDSDVTLEDLRAEGVTEEILSALDCLTRREGESYEAFIDRIKPNPLARAVKFADLTDNLRLSRIANPAEKDESRIGKYKRAWEQLGGN